MHNLGDISATRAKGVIVIWLIFLHHCCSISLRGRTAGVQRSYVDDSFVYQTFRAGVLAMKSTVSTLHLGRSRKSRWRSHGRPVWSRWSGVSPALVVWSRRRGTVKLRSREFFSLPCRRRACTCRFLFSERYTRAITTQKDPTK